MRKKMVVFLTSIYGVTTLFAAADWLKETPEDCAAAHARPRPGAGLARPRPQPEVKVNLEEFKMKVQFESELVKSLKHLHGAI